MAYFIDRGLHAIHLNDKSDKNKVKTHIQAEWQKHG